MIFKKCASAWVYKRPALRFSENLWELTLLTLKKSLLERLSSHARAETTQVPQNPAQKLWGKGQKCTFSAFRGLLKNSYGTVGIGVSLQKGAWGFRDKNEHFLAQFLSRGSWATFSQDQPLKIQKPRIDPDTRALFENACTFFIFRKKVHLIFKKCASVWINSRNLEMTQAIGLPNSLRRFEIPRIDLDTRALSE